MIHHYNLQPTVWHAKPWVFSWNDETGEVAGSSAADVLEMSSWGGISAHPVPWAHKFSAEPLKNKTDMAAIIGWEHHLPDDLADFYPKLPDDGIPEKSYIDEDGIMVLGRDTIQY